MSIEVYKVPAHRFVEEVQSQGTPLVLGGVPSSAQATGNF